MPRVFAFVLLILAVFGLALSPAAACQTAAQPAPVTAASAPAASCHGMDMADAATMDHDGMAPGKDAAKVCCKTTCAPALPAAEHVFAERAALPLMLHAPGPHHLTGSFPPLDDPPPRTQA